MSERKHSTLVPRRHFQVFSNKLRERLKKGIQDFLGIMTKEALYSKFGFSRGQLNRILKGGEFITLNRLLVSVIELGGDVEIKVKFRGEEVLFKKDGMTNKIKKVEEALKENS